MGSKQTFDCPAPRAVVADLDVIADAPPGMNASGYADLLAKGVAGADWILADAAGEEPIDPAAWATVQEFLPSWVDSPARVARGRAGKPPAAGRRSDDERLRDAGGADQPPRLGGRTPVQPPLGHAAPHPRGRRPIARVQGRDRNPGVAGTLRGRCAGTWNTSTSMPRSRTLAVAGAGRVTDRACSARGSRREGAEETRAKYPALDALRAQLVRLREGWPAVRAG